MFHFIVPEKKIMICCFKKQYVSKLCFRKSEIYFHHMNNTMFHETLKDGLQKACCSCSSLYILRITEHVLRLDKFDMLIAHQPFRLNCAIRFWITPLILKNVKMQIDVYVRHNSVLWNCVRLSFSNEKPPTDQKMSPLRFIPSSNFIIENNYNRGQYFTVNTI